MDIILNTTATLHNIATFSMAERPKPLITKPGLYHVFDWDSRASLVDGDRAHTSLVAEHLDKWLSLVWRPEGDSAVGVAQVDDSIVWVMGHHIQPWCRWPPPPYLPTRPGTAGNLSHSRGGVEGQEEFTGESWWFT